MQSYVAVGHTDGRSVGQAAGWDVFVVDVAAGNKILDVGVVGYIRDEDGVDLGG